MTNKRKFPRKKLERSFDLVVSGEHLPAVITDISPSGMGILIRNRADISSDTLDLRVKDLDLDCTATIVWKRKIVSGIRVGLSRKGPIRGRLSTYGFSDIVLGLQRAKKTGVLYISAPDWKRQVIFREGDLVFSSSDLKAEQLGSMLIAEGRITGEQRDRAVAAAMSSGKSEGGMLVELGYLSPQELITAVHRRVETVILNLCGSDNAEFSFSEDPLPRDETVSMKLNSADLIYRGYRNAANFRAVREGILHPDSMISAADPSSAGINGLTLDEDDRRILSLARDWVPLRDILSRSPLSAELTLRILYGLASVQAINIETFVVRHEEEEAEEEPAEIEQTDDAATATKIEKLYNIYKSLGYLGILGLGPSPTATEIKRAYYEMAKEYHPDRYLHIRSEALREKLNIIFAYISEAYRELSKSGGHVTRPSETRQEKSEPVDNKTLAKSKYSEGREMVAARDFEQAMTLFGQAVYLDDRVADYHYYYGLTLIKNKKIKDAEISIRKALKLSPLNSTYITELGNIYLKLGFRTRAKNTFEQALKINPGNRSAAEGLKKAEEME